MTQPASIGVRTAGPAGMPEVAGDANDSFQAFLTSHKGAGVPPYRDVGTEYLVDATTPWVKSVWDGSQGLPIYAMDPTAHRLFLGNGQVVFPATQNPSSDPNTLDDYEEGTFTAIVSGTGAGGAGSYITQQGTYTKIGNTVRFTHFTEWSTHSGTGNIRLDGLPFSGVVVAPSAVAIRVRNLTFPNPTLQAFVSGSSVFVEQVASGSVNQGINMDTAASIMASGVYQTV